MESDLKVQLSRPNCAYCKAPVEISESKKACEACMSWSHSECVEAHGACPACGDPAGPSAPRPVGSKHLSAKEAQQASEPGESVLPTPEAQAGNEGAEAGLVSEQHMLFATPRGTVQTTTTDLLLLLLVGMACFVISMFVVSALIGTIGRALGFFNEPGAISEILVYAVMGSGLSTTIFLIYAGTWITKRRADLIAAENPE